MSADALWKIPGLPGRAEGQPSEAQKKQSRKRVQKTRHEISASQHYRENDIYADYTTAASPQSIVALLGCENIHK